MRVKIVLIMLTVIGGIVLHASEVTDNAFKIKDNVTNAFGITFGTSLTAEIRRFGGTRVDREISGLIQAGSGPKYAFKPRNPFTVGANFKKSEIGNYDVEVTGKNNIAFKVTVTLMKMELNDSQQTDVLNALRKKYGEFKFKSTDNASNEAWFKKHIANQYGAQYAILQSEKNPQRWIIVEDGSDIVITFYCRDIEEKYQNKSEKVDVRL